MFFRPGARRPLAALPVILALVSPELALAQAVQISGAWARATAPQQQEGAVYMSLTSPAGDRLTAVACPEAAGQTVRLAPRGMHIMLMGLKQKLKPGDRIDVELTFSKAGHETVRVPVQPIGAAGPPG
jgi:copper(I)-binding protein